MSRCKPARRWVVAEAGAGEARMQLSRKDSLLVSRWRSQKPTSRCVLTKVMELLSGNAS